MKVLKLDGVYCNDMRGLLTAGIAARCLGLPVMIWDKLDKPHGWMDWLQLPLVRKNIIISKAVLRKYPAWQVRLLRNRIELVHEGADLERFQGTKSVRRTLGLGEGDLVLALIGSVTERKGHDRIFSLWPDLSAAFPSLRLWVVGGTEADGKYMENLPNKNHPGVRFLGFREDIPDLLESIDILLIPSRNEGLPLVVMEAMAASRPVIGSDAGGIPEVVLDGVTGLVVRGDDGEGWKAAIGRLASSPELRAQMGLAGRKRVEAEFNRPAQMKKVLEHLLDMTHGR
jgi:glycosyltransferase involved in cell wall biosynthesis